MNHTPNYILLTAQGWHNDLFNRCIKEVHGNWTRLSSKEKVNYDYLKSLNPDKIFIPHWSHIIPEEVTNEFECIIFHMTDLPFGRGGSPLQNLIVRGFKETKISAIRAEKGLDTGPIYLKKNLNLEGTAQEIFERTVPIIFDMIKEIAISSPTPIDQSGEPTLFKRRKPEDGNISKLKELEKIYDYIRMLDAEGYPKAFVEFDNFKLEFSSAKMDENATLEAHVRITKK